MQLGVYIQPLEGVEDLQGQMTQQTSENNDGDTIQIYEASKEDEEL